MVPRHEPVSDRRALPGGTGGNGMPGALPPDRSRVSVIVPCRNEAPHIAGCLDSLLSGDWPPERLEVLVVDGMSVDGTRDIVEAYAKRHPIVRLLSNPRKIAPVAMNIGITAARGDFVVRADAHATFPPDYLSRLVSWMQRSGADNVGGVLVTLPDGAGRMARAIARAVAHPFGVGNAHFRIGTTTPRWVDSVPFGCWRRSTLARIGLFDEELVRNEDDELNFRLIKAGGRLLLVPDVTVQYYARKRLALLWRTYWQYGFFKPLVARKVGAVITVRQLVPAGFVAAIVGSAIAAPFDPLAMLFLLLGTGIYALTTCAVALLASRPEMRMAPCLAAAFATIHLAYGAGYLCGLWQFVVRGTSATRYSTLRLSR